MGFNRQSDLREEKQDEPGFAENWLKGLFTDWRQPDGTQQAKVAMQDMDYPSLSALLPYRYYDPESGLFINQKTAGFVLECTPLIGANNEIVDALDYFLRHKLPRQTPITFLLLGSKCISDVLGEGLAESRWGGPMADRFNHITQAYYESGALKGLRNEMKYPLSLRNYRLFVCHAETIKRPDNYTLQRINKSLEVVQESLQSAFIQSHRLDDKKLVQLVSELVNFRHGQIKPPSIDIDPYQTLNTQCVDHSINLMLEPDCIRQSVASPCGGNEKTRILNFMLAKNPTRFALWQGGDNLSNLLNPSSTLPCPFVITLTVEVEEQAKSQNKANRRFLSNESRAESKFAKWVPGVKKAAKEWGELRERLNKGEDALARYSYGITLFCEDDDSDALKCEMALQNTFASNGLTLCPPTFLQMRNYLAMFPFTMQEGLWVDMQRSGGTLPATSFNVVNLLPVVADNKISPQGIPIPSYRNQLSFLNLFDKKSGLGNDNFNLGVCGTSGSGKSFLMQAIIRYILDSGGRAWAFDMGDSYKSLCASVGGVYIDATTLKFNPFAGVVDIRESAESIRDLLLVLTNPSGRQADIDVVKSILLNTVQAVWEGEAPSGRAGNAVLIDDVSEYLRYQLRHNEELKGAVTLCNHMQEIVVALHKYTTGGIYGEYFNSPAPALDDSVRFSVLEMGALKNKPDLLAAIMFSMMIYVEQRMFLSPRSELKAALIDEAWKLLANDNSFIADFIENGYRTARKYGGAYITVTQGIEDFDGDKASRAAYAAWSNSSFKIILRQNAEAFRTYNQKNPDQFSVAERTIISKFPGARDAGFSAMQLRVGDQKSYHRLFIDPLSRAMFSSDGPDFEFREQCLKQGMHIQDALYLLAKRNYPDEMEELEAWKINTPMAA